LNRTSAGSLSRILGFGFSIALAIGGTIGVGILRLPGEVAAQLGDGRLTIIVWIIGGVYALLGAISVAELAAMLPAAGGFYVYARRAFGPVVGFVIGWNDWILNSVTIAYAAYTAADFMIRLRPAWAGHQTMLALACVGVFAGLHWRGLRFGSVTQNVLSSTIGLLLVGLAVACFFVPGHAADAPAAVSSVAGQGVGTLGFYAAIAAALRSVIVAYDGWYNAIYLSEETVDAGKNVPRAMLSCAVLVTVLYVLINAGFVHALSFSALAASKLPAADVANVLLPHGGDTFVTILSLCVVLGLINAVFLGAPRILFALSRDGLLGGRAATVSAGGTPRPALGFTALAAALLIVAGDLERLVSIAAVLFVMNYVSAYAGLYTLRWREPGAPRPYRTPGFPWTTACVLIGSVSFFVLTVLEDPQSAAMAVGLAAIAIPIHRYLGAPAPPRA
jgi:basic amino acid/polyamine antiporter, APA family